MSKYQIYHKPKCIKSRKTLELLKAEGIEPEVIEYLKSPLSEDKLLEILKILDSEPKTLVRTKESLFKENDFSIDTPEEIAKTIAQNPKLMERPLVVKGNQAVLGRPPENVKSLF